jgi:hypothetical protein
MPDHSSLIWVRDRAGFQLPHFGKCFLRARPHRGQKIVGKPHPTDIEAETDIVVA